MAAPADPFLREHFQSPLIFDLGGPRQPLSIRDQMNRAVMAVDRLFAEQIIDRGQRSLLVAGGGAAGATAAVQAAGRGVTTMLVERATECFLRQSGCLSRWVDPAQYDWPVTHWSAGQIPFDPATQAALPFAFSAGMADGIAMGWLGRLRGFELRYGHALRVRRETQLAGTALVPPRGRQMIQCRFDSTHPGRTPPNPESFGAVLMCTGHGFERTQLTPTHPFRSVPFWGPDQLAAPNFGVQGKWPPSVLISGSGDRAIQDFLRVVTKHRSAADLLAALPVRIPDDAGRQLHELADQWARAYCWGSGKAHDHATFTALDHGFRSVVRDLLATVAGFPAAVDGLLKSPVPDVLLVHRCDHLDCYYPLNRLLAHLIAERMRDRGRVLIQGRTSVEEIRGLHAPHAPTQTCGDPHHCYGLQHQVDLHEFDDCRLSVGAPRATRTFDVVLLRHGIEPVTVPPPPQRRHALPYFLPH